MKKLNFGCGNDIREGWDNCDMQEGEGVISFDADTFPYPIKDNTYDYVEIKHVLNMLDRPDKTLYEIWRICKNKARVRVIVPYFNNKGASNDIQVKHYFNEIAFINFIEQKPCKIDTKKKFELVEFTLTPTSVGKFLPKTVREKFAIFIGGIISEIHLTIKVKK